jgi:ubiquinone/menaquinone biosynthesis C-methylase UbiE
VLVDLGSGPGLFLRDVSSRIPDARLHGVDQATDMIENARSLEYAGEPPTLALHDIAADPLPLADVSVDLLCIAAVMHTFQDPFRFLDEVRRVLAPNGLFLLYDWIRVPFEEYIAYRQREPGDPEELRYPRALELFATHNKYTADDWRWILAQGRYEIVAASSPYPRARVFLCRAAS